MVLWSSNLFPDHGSSSSSSETSIKQTTKSAVNIMDTLKCYVCGHFYVKPRILPCGHSYCEKCVSGLRESAIQEFNKSRDRNAHRRGDCGFFTCPWPNCHYSMRIMNVSRWTLKNKALSKAVSEAKRLERERQVFNSFDLFCVTLFDLICTRKARFHGYYSQVLSYQVQGQVLW